MSTPAPLANPIGAHVSGGKHLARARADIERLGVEVAQVFLSSPRAYAMASYSTEEDAEFRRWAEGADVPVFVHGPYLMNFGSPSAETREKSAAILRANLTRATAVGARGVVLHSGSATSASKEEGYKRVRESLLPLLASLPEECPPVLLEPMAGQGKSLASTVESVQAYLEAVDAHPKLAVCLDTAHLIAAGEPLDVEGGATAVLEEFDRRVGLERLHLLHANDSKKPRGSHLDRHENLGAGTVHPGCWGELLAHPKMTAPLVIETPGGGYLRDLAFLRAERARVAKTS